MLLTNRQKNRQTNQRDRKHYLLGGGNYIPETRSVRDVMVLRALPPHPRPPRPPPPRKVFRVNAITFERMFGFVPDFLGECSRAGS